MDWKGLTDFVRDVSGWMPLGFVDTLRRLGAAQEAAGISGHVLEIGVFHGRSFLPLRAICGPREHAVALDLFEQGRDTRPQFIGNYVGAFGQVDRQLVVVPADSTTVTPGKLLGLSGGPYRVVSVDGGHSMKVAMHDLELADAITCPGAAILVDDMDSPRWPDVPKAVDAFVARSKRWRLAGTAHNRGVLLEVDTPLDFAP